MAQISGTIKRLVFQNKENGYSVLKTTQDQTLCGILYEVSANLDGAEFVANGEWQKHKKFGHQFVFDTFEINESKLFYFLCRIVRGLGKKLSKTLIDKYGDEELETILDTKPEKLLKVKGIKHKKLKKVTESWHKFKHLKSIAEAIIPYGGTQAIVNRVYRHFQDDLTIAAKIRANPYIITEIKGIGFKTADRIALKMGITPDSPHRIKACIDYVILFYTNNEGNSCILLKILFELMNKELKYSEEIEELPKTVFMETLREMEQERRIYFLTEAKITSLHLYLAETAIYELCQAKGVSKRKPYHPNIINYINEKEKELGFLFGAEQKEAIALANKGQLSFILCGYAGTGKSTISKAILDLVNIQINRKKIICCALSGIASDRIRKTSGYDAATIQSLLVKAEKDGKDLPYQVVLVDEASMVNSEILHRLIKALKEDTILILVGDPAQLPPIGPGDPFHDLIQKKVVPVIELTKLYRQSEEQVIALFANYIRQAEVPKAYWGDYEDFSFIDVSIKNYYEVRKGLKPHELKELRDSNSLNIQRNILQVAREYLREQHSLFAKKEINDYIRFLQVITPIKSGLLGVETLNVELQQVLNYQTNPDKFIDFGLVKFNIGDKVVHTVNLDMDCYSPENFKKDEREKYVGKKRIFNGMLGVLFKIDKKDELLWVFYPNNEDVVEYTFDEARDILKLAYALTIHKTQGSEFQNIVIPMTLSHFNMLNNKLLYTAITRAKTNCILIGEKYAFTSACKRKDVTVRDTVMKLFE